MGPLRTSFSTWHLVTQHTLHIHGFVLDPIHMPWPSHSTPPAAGLSRQKTLKPRELVSRFFWQHYEKYEQRLHRIKMAELVSGV